MKFILPLVFAALLCAPALEAQAVAIRSKGNPIAPHIFAADPSAHVWPQDPDTLWIYSSHDHAGTNHYDSMTGYHAFSTKDLVNWTDHGQILSLDKVPWAASHAWAPDAVYHQGKYYLLYPMKEKRTGVFMVGLGVSDRPEGPFKDQGFIEGSEWGQDPAAFVDDDGQVYLFWGHDYLMYGAKLSNDLRRVLPGTKVNLSSQLKDSYEGPWLNKIGGKYYLSYASIEGRRWPETLSYATAEHPLGPYTSKGLYLGKFGMQSETVHGAIVKFKGRWLSIYHSSWGSGGNSENRSLMAEFLTINEDGSWQMTTPTSTGVSGGKTPSSRILLEAESAEDAGGKLICVVPKSALPGFSGRGYVEGFHVSKENAEAFYAVERDCPSCVKRASVGSVTVLAQVAHDQDYQLKLRYSADQDTRLHVFVNRVLIKGVVGNSNELWAKATGGNFDMYDLGPVRLKAGDNEIKIHTRDNRDLRLDAVELIPIYSR